MQANIDIKMKKNEINWWLEIKTQEKANSHIQNMLNEMNKSRRILYLEKEAMFIYNTESLIRIDDYIKKNSDEKSLANILIQAIEIQKKCIEHLIPLDCILFDYQYTFINIESKTLEFIIIPVKLNESQTSFEDWIKCFLDSIEENGQAIFKEKILSNININNLCLSELSALLKGRGEDKKIIINEGFMLDEFYKLENEDIVDYYQNDENHMLNDNFEIAKSDIYKASYPKNDFNKTPFLRINKKKKSSDSKEEDKIVYKNSEKESGFIKKELAIIIFQALMIIVLIAAIIYSLNTFLEAKKAISGIAIIWLVINYFISKEIILNKKNASPKENKKSEKSRQKMSKNKRSYFCKQNINKINKKKNNFSSKSYEESETQYLNPPTSNNFFLKNFETKDLIILDKPKNIVGRKSDEVDILIDDPSVGRIHAIISIENQNVFLMDNSSLNGSYINNRRLGASEKVKLNIGDELKFARMSFTLINKVS